LPKEIKETFEKEIKTFVYYDKKQGKLTGPLWYTTPTQTF
jgi:hypothetical protein